MKTDQSSEIISATKVTVRPANRNELCLTISSLIDLIRREEGCRSYRFYRESEDQNSFLLVGEWETQAAWGSHLNSDHFAILHGSLELLRDESDVDFKLMAHLHAIEALTRARCELHEALTIR